ncbi:MAG: prolyl oligopeptidase family serine peptidase [Rubricoccaceae bacterium]
MLLLVRPLAVLACASLIALAPQAQQRPMTWADVMQFRDVEHVTISETGTYVAFTAEPDRGDPEGIVRATSGEGRHSIPLGSHPALTRVGDYAAFRLNPPLAEVEARKDADEDPLKPGMVLLATATGDTLQIPRVEQFAFSGDGAWLAFRITQPEDTTAADSASATPPHTAATDLVLRQLATGDTVHIAHVSAFAFDDLGQHIAYSVEAPDSLRDGLYLRELASPRQEETLDRRPHGTYSHLTWREDATDFAFLVAETDTTGERSPANVWVWDGHEAASTTDASPLPNGWIIPSEHNRLSWTEDGDRLFFGLRPDELADSDDADDDSSAVDLYDLDAILEDRTVDVWHWDDPLIQPNQKREWQNEQRRTHQAVLHRRSGEVVALGTDNIRAIGAPDNPQVTLGASPNPYFKERTWAGRFHDLYVIDLNNGTHTQIAERLASSARSLSPEGRYVAFYDAGDWHLYDVRDESTRNLTADLGVPFANEDHDYPNAPPGYGLGGWIEDDAALLIYDKYDVWQIPTDRGTPFRITGGAGREEKRIYRVIDLDPDEDTIPDDASLLLLGYHDLEKSDGFYRATVGRDEPKVGVSQLAPLAVEDKRFRVIGKAEDADVVLITREDYDEFPDLWATTPDLASPTKLTDVNPQMREIAWGDSELVEWSSTDGTPMQGVVIKPEDYDPSRRYPVLVYFYRFFSQRLHEFTQPAINHRPIFPLYASDDYVIFLPDVRFEVGRPGFSATKSVVPGVQRLIDLGIAAPDAVGLHGHSWSGYQTAFMVTQTDLFASAITGAPVSNMTSAYSGIRHGSGLARQFQYEQGQSRISGSLWEARDEYIDNSPIFFADRVRTPLLILHGDADGAVPWEQSVELYLALRRLERPAWLLQYRGEDHHPQTYPNKLDWALRMKAFFDHTLKGEPAPAWITEGVPYAGE